MKRWCGVVCGVVVALSGCTGDDLAGEGEGETAEGEGEGEAAEGEGEGEGEREDDIVAACAALDAELGVTRPEGWDPLVHCKKATPNGEVVFGGLTTLAITMTADEYAAMQADFEDLTGGGGGGGDVLVAACEGKAIDDPCSADIGRGDEPGVCADLFGGTIGCFLDSFRTPQEWIDACVGLSEGDDCTTADHSGQCFSDGRDLACFGDVAIGEGEGEGEGEGGSCNDAAAGDTCSNGAATGVCTAAGDAVLVCMVDGFDDANVDDVSDEAAAQFWPREPNYFHADLTFAGKTFRSVGIRYKGNNGLAQARGEKKPLRIKLDEWEDDIPAITDQRLFGYQLLSLSPNTTDQSQLHQVLAASVFRQSGVPAPEAGFVEVTLDSGSGPRLLGVYAMSEIPDDPLLERVFGNDSGNLYKPDGRGAHFVSFVAASMHKENNDEAPLDDVQAFVTALHADQSDRAAWRTALTASFDMEGFAAYYGVNQAIGNWDTYGGLAHNFYLYGDPDDGGRLKIIGWDFDLSFDGTGATDLTLESFDGKWPLIQAVARDPVFARAYLDQLDAVLTAQFDSGALLDEVDAYEALIQDAVERENAVNPGVSASFEQGLSSVRSHIDQQQDALQAHLEAVGIR